MSSFQIPKFTPWTFPESVAATLNAVACECRTDISMGITPLMSALATLAQGKFIVEVKTPQGAGYTSETSMIWLGIADSGEGKGPVFKKIIAPIEAAVADTNNRRREEFERILSFNTSLEELVKSKRRALSRCPANELEAAMEEIQQIEAKKKPLIAPMVFSTQNCTSAGLRKLLAEQVGQRVGILDAEGGSVRQIFEDPALISFLNQAYDRETLDSVRSSVPSFCGLRGSVSMGLFMQGEKLADLTRRSRTWGEGFFPRAMVVFSPSMAGFRTPLGGVTDTRLWTSYAERVRYILEFPWKNSTTGEHIPHILQLSPEASSTWYGWSQHLETQMAFGSPLAPLKSWLSKAPNAILRIAALYHLFECSGDPTASKISAHHIQMAGDLIKNIVPHVDVIYKATNPDPRVDVLKKIRLWLLCHCWTTYSFNLRDLYRSTSLKREFVLPAIEWLLQSNAITPSYGYGLPPQQETGRPRSPQYCINFDVLRGLNI